MTEHFLSCSSHRVLNNWKKWSLPGDIGSSFSGSEVKYFDKAVTIEPKLELLHLTDVDKEDIDRCILEPLLMERFKYLAFVSLFEDPTEIQQTLDKLLPDQRRINSKSSMDTLRSPHLGRRHCKFIS